MDMINGLGGGISSITNGYGAAKSANLENEMSQFQRMLDDLNPEKNPALVNSAENTGVNPTVSPKIVESGRLNGDFTSGFGGTYTSKADKNALPSGFAANSASVSSKKGTIDKTSKLYEKAQELESYFVKIMLQSMRNTIHKASLTGEESHANKVYEDMLYDEMAVSMTKNAGFGLADQIYMELA